MSPPPLGVRRSGVLWSHGGSAVLDLSETWRRVAEAMGETARAPGYLASVPELAAFLAAGLAAGPPSAGLGEETFSLEAQQYLADAACDLAADAWRPEEAGDAPVTDDLGRDATYEVLAATAACSAHEETGRISIEPAFVQEAVRRVAAFGAGAAGLGPLVRAYCTVAAFEDLQAVDFYQPLDEETFVSGAWHRPWVSHALHGELLMAAASGLVRLRRGHEGTRQLQITAHGRAVLAEVQGRLGASGMLAERRRLLALAHRNALAHLTAAVHAGPSQGLHQVWAELLAAAGIRAGSRVLLCGLAVGGEALIRHIAEVVGPAGAVYVADPAVAAVRHFGHRTQAPGAALPPQVRLLPGRFEALPLSDGAADACLAPSFLHLGEDDRALAEIRRVVRPGGRVALAVPHAVDPGHALLREWLEPLLELAARFEVPASGRLHAPGQAMDALARQGFVGVEVRAHALPVAAHAHGALWQLLHGAEVGRAVLERVPWRERHDLLRALADRGERLWAASEAAAGGLVAAGEVVVGTVP